MPRDTRRRRRQEEEKASEEVSQRESKRKRFSSLRSRFENYVVETPKKRVTKQSAKSNKKVTDKRSVNNVNTDSNKRELVNKNANKNRSAQMYDKSDILRKQSGKGKSICGKAGGSKEKENPVIIGDGIDVYVDPQEFDFDSELDQDDLEVESEEDENQILDTTGGNNNEVVLGGTAASEELAKNPHIRQILDQRLEEKLKCNVEGIQR